MGVIGPDLDLNYRYTKISNSLSGLNDIKENKSEFSNIFHNSKNPLIIIGTSAINNSEGASVLKLCADIAKKLPNYSNTFNPLNILNQDISRVGSLELGFVNKYFDKNFEENLKENIKTNKPVIFLLGLDEIDPKNLEQAFVVYIGHHGDLNAQHADIILPSPAYTEKTSTFMNIEGRVIQTSRCHNPLGEAKEEWKIFRVLSDLMNCDLQFNNLNDVRKHLVDNNKNFLQILECNNTSNLSFASPEVITEHTIEYNISNFYMNDSISRSSETMANCTNEILNKTKSFMNSFSYLNDLIIPGGIIIAQIMAVLMPVLISVAFLVYAERKVLALIQLRRGPNVVGPFGILQSFADALKLLTKENIVPANSNKIVFLLAPIITMVLSLAGWAVIPFAPNWVIADINVGIMYLFAVSSLGVYGIIMAGWASNSQYPFLGALRSAAQMVSYEVSIGFVIITVLLCVGSLNLSKIVEAQETVWFAIPLLPMFVVFFISALAETNRLPFDLPEDESTLVAGFFTEYSSLLLYYFSW